MRPMMDDLSFFYFLIFDDMSIFLWVYLTKIFSYDLKKIINENILFINKMYLFDYLHLMIAFRFKIKCNAKKTTENFYLWAFLSFFWIYTLQTQFSYLALFISPPSFLFKLLI